MVIVATWARVNSCHQHKGGGIIYRHLGTTDGDAPFLHRLAQHLQHLTAELWQFIKEKNSIMGKTDFTRLGVGATAHQRYIGYSMVRRSLSKG